MNSTIVFIRFPLKLNFFDRISTNSQTPTTMNIHPLTGRCSVSTDGRQTDRYDEDNSRFSKYCEPT